MHTGSLMDRIQAFYGAGDVWMHFIAAAGAIGYAFTFYKIFTLVLIYNCNGKSLTDQVIKLVISGQFERAIKFCNSRARAILPKVLRAGLTRHASSGEVIETAMEEVAMQQLPKAGKYLDLIGTIANISTMLGLLGTVAGMIAAFEAVSKVAPEQRGEVLGQAIAVSLNCTMFGLIVAIPLMFAHGVITTLADKVHADVEFGAKTLWNALIIGTSAPVQGGSFGIRSFSANEPTRTGVARVAGGAGGGQAAHGGPQSTVPFPPGHPGGHLKNTGS
jgi:biopolymer transport protein ExbB/TolQ